MLTQTSVALDSCIPGRLERGEVLLIGHDDDLARTRGMVLESIGFRCRQHAVRAALSDLHGTQFVVVVLCHTLVAVEACSFAATVYQRMPFTPVLRMTRDSETETGCFTSVLRHAHPDLLVQEVRRLAIESMMRRIRHLASSVEPLRHEGGVWQATGA